MLVPMSTLKSGRRQARFNRHVSQAHACCVEHPLQVPHILQVLRETPSLRSVRHWPYAYTIPSPIDGSAHVGNNDDGDPGTSEKMLGLLTRLGLRNVLLVVSRWDSGLLNHIGTEAFSCIYNQCKELLSEFQLENCTDPDTVPTLAL